MYNEQALVDCLDAIATDGKEVFNIIGNHMANKIGNLKTANVEKAISN